MAEGNVGWQLQTLKYDMMRDYRNTVPVEQQDQIWEEVTFSLFILVNLLSSEPSCGSGPFLLDP